MLFRRAIRLLGCGVCSENLSDVLFRRPREKPSCHGRLHIPTGLVLFRNRGLSAQCPRIDITLGLIMPLTPGFNTIHDMLAKLERDADLLVNDAVTSDRFLNFVLTGYSMIDWVKNDPTVPAGAKVARISLYSNQALKICGDLANAGKHFSLTTRTPITKDATTEIGYGVGRYGLGGYGEGEEEIQIELNDGTALNALDLVRDVISEWKTFFAAHGI